MIDTPNDMPLTLKVGRKTNKQTIQKDWKLKGLVVRAGDSVLIGPGFENYRRYIDMARNLSILQENSIQYRYPISYRNHFDSIIEIQYSIEKY